MQGTISDEEYLVNCAINAQKLDPHAAKAWLLTAKTMFPQSFRVQFEGYNIQKNAGNMTEAADCLLKIYKEFKHCSELWKEIKQIWEVLNSDAQDSESKVLKDVFLNIPKDMQQHILLCAAENSKDTLEQCTIIFLVLKLFPRCIRQHGLPLIDMFLAAEDRLSTYNPLNVFRTLFVSEVLPLLLKSQHISMPPEQLYQLLIKGMEYYIMLIIKPNETAVGDVQDTKQAIWKKLFELTHMFAKKLNWEMSDLFTSGSNPESQWQRLHNLYLYCKEIQDKSRMRALQPQVTICTVILFIYCLHQYSLVSCPAWFNSSGSSSSNLVLVEEFIFYSNKKCQTGSKEQTRSSQLRVSPLIKPKISAALTQNFVIAVKCYHLLISDPMLQAEFHQTQVTLKMEQWHWYYAFQTDALIFQEKYNFAINTLSVMQNYNKQEYDEKTMLKSDLQMASCFHFSKNYKGCCEKVMKVLSNLSCLESNGFKVLSSVPSRSGRNVCLLSLVQEEVLGFCISLLVSCLKALSKQTVQDVILGHIIVLLQYDWPNGEEEFLQILEFIKQRGAFNYAIFFNYVINIDILEEFAYLGNIANRNFITLNLLPSNAQHSKQRAITRGINKEVKEDFRQALEKQVMAEQPSLHDIILSFLIVERDSIISCFGS